MAFQPFGPGKPGMKLDVLSFVFLQAPISLVPLVIFMVLSWEPEIWGAVKVGWSSEQKSESENNICFKYLIFLWYFSINDMIKKCFTYLFRVPVDVLRPIGICYWPMHWTPLPIIWWWPPVWSGCPLWPSRSSGWSKMGSLWWFLRWSFMIPFRCSNRQLGKRKNMVLKLQ